MKTNTDAQKIENIVSRGVERIFPNEDFLRSRLNSGEQLTLYLGIDPTGPTLHMGHVIPMIKLAQFQQLGHKIILLIGDFTARIGDPDKSELRKQLTHKEILENAKLYQEQASLFLDFEGDNPAELKYNAEWLDKMNFADVLELASKMTVQRMLDRDMFRRRVDAGTPVYIHEFMYPLMQGYDSVAMDVDGEVGGNDQTFNMLVGRDLLKLQNPPKEKFVVPMKLLVDSNGEKMGKTTGNMMSFLDSADDKFKKIMTWSDDMILIGFELLTDVSLDEIKKRLETDENPRDIKFDLAHKIVTVFHNSDLADKAKDSWLNEVQKKIAPEVLNKIHINSLEVALIQSLAEKLNKSNSEIRRLYRDGAIKIDGKKINEDDMKKLISIELVGKKIQIGKKDWVEIVK